MLAQRYQLGSLEAWQDFLWTLELSEGGGLTVLFLLVPDPSGEPVCREALAQHLAGRGQVLQSLVATTPEQLHDLTGAVLSTAPEPNTVVWVAAQEGIDKAWESAWRFLLQRLNERRNHLYDKVPVPLIFCGPASLRSYCWSSAPDLWSIRAGVIEIIPPPEASRTTQESLSVPTSMTGYGYNGDPTLPLEEAERLRSNPEPRAQTARLRNLLRAAESLMNRYQWEYAEGVLREADSLANTHGTPRQRAEIAWRIGQSYHMRSLSPQAAKWFQAGAKLAQEENVPFWEANCIMGLADTHLRKSELDESELRYQEAIPKFKVAGDPIGEANCIRGLANIHLRKSELDESERLYQEAIPKFKAAGGPIGEANCIKGLADIHLRKSELDESELRYQEAIPKFKAAGDPLGEANCIQGLADIHLRKSELDESELLYREAIPKFNEAGDSLGEANCIKGLADIHLRKSELDESERRYQEAISIYQNGGAKIGEANCIQRLADIHLRKSELDESERRYQEAIPIYQNAGDKVGEGNCLHYLGVIALRRGDFDGARIQMEAASQLYVVAEMASNVAESWYCQSFLPNPPEVQQELKQRARQLWGQFLTDEQIAFYEAQVQRELTGATRA